jgi:hypothetical protein
VRQLFAARSSARSKSSTEDEIGARIRVKNSRRSPHTPRITRHRFAHFLIDSGRRAPFATQFVKNILACADVCGTREAYAKLSAHAQKYFDAR